MTLVAVNGTRRHASPPSDLHAGIVVVAEAIGDDVDVEELLMKDSALFMRASRAHPLGGRRECWIAVREIEHRPAGGYLIRGPVVLTEVRV